MGGRESLPLGRLCSRKRMTYGETLCDMEQFVFRRSAGSRWAHSLFRRRNVKVCIPGKLRVAFDSLSLKSFRVVEVGFNISKLNCLIVLTYLLTYSMEQSPS